jgi:paraquat-inducible protein B
MSKQASKTMIGGFVVGAVVLAVIAVVIFGSGQFFRERPKYVMFFQGSVKGLNVGAPVVFKGVRVGTVKDIFLHLHAEELAIDIPVIVELGEGKWSVSQVTDKDIVRLQTKQARKEMMDNLIQQGLRAQLEIQSLVTGQLMISLDFHPDKPPKFVHRFPDYPEIPTIPTTFQQVAEKIDELDFEQLADDVKNTLQGVNNLVNSPELAQAITNLNETLKGVRSIAAKVDAKTEPILTGIDGTFQDTRQLVRNVDEQAGPLLRDTRDLVKNVDDQVDPVASDIRTALQSATATLNQAKSAVARIQSQMGPDSVLHYRLDEALREISAAARSFRVLADYLEQHPEALLQGKTLSGGK